MSSDISRRRILQLAAMPALLARQDLQLRDMAPTVSRVYPGADGKLVYVPDEQGNIIHDASHAGYGGGGVAIPTVPVKETIWPVAGDNTANIQARDRQGGRRCRSTGTASAARCCSGPATTGWRRPSRSAPAASCCAARAWATPARSSSAPARAGRPPRPTGPRGARRAPAAPAGAPGGRPWWRCPARPLRPGGGPGRGGGGFGGGPATLDPHRRRGGRGAARRDQAGGARRVRAGRRAELQGGVGARLQARRHRDRPAHRQPGVDRCGRHEHRLARRPLAALQHRLGSRRRRRAGQHGHGRRADHLRDREALGRRRDPEVRGPRPDRTRRDREPARHLGVRSRRADARRTATWTARTTSPRSTTPTRTTTATSSRSTT